MDRYLFRLFALMMLLTSSSEGPVELSSVPPPNEKDEEPQLDGHVFGFEAKSKESSRPSSVFESSVRYHPSMYRYNYSRMLPVQTSTAVYDDLLFHPTRISPLSLKDFPGVPGVASWREISNYNPESRNSRKMKRPKAEGVSSSSWSFSPNFHLALTGIWMLLFAICFY